MKFKNIFLISGLLLVLSMATFAASFSRGQIQVTLNNTTGQTIVGFHMFPGWENITPSYVVNTLPAGKTTLEFSPIDPTQQSGFALMAGDDSNYFVMSVGGNPVAPNQNIAAHPRYDYGCEGYGALQATTCHARFSAKGVYKVTVDVNSVH